MALQTLIERLRKKTAAEVRVNEALDAARTLQQDPRTRVARYRNAAVTGGALKPVVHGIGRIAEAVATAPRGGRLAAVGRAAVRTSRGELAKHVAEGAVGGGGIRAVQEGLEVGQAKKKVTKFLNQPEPKLAVSKEWVVQRAMRARVPLSRIERVGEALMLSGTPSSSWYGMRGGKAKNFDRVRDLRLALGTSLQDRAATVRAVTPEKTAAKSGTFTHLVKAHWRRKKASLGEHLAREVVNVAGRRKLSGTELRTALRDVAKLAAEKKPAQSRLPLKPVASPDFDFEV